MVKYINLDSMFSEQQNEVVYSKGMFFRYMKKFKDQLTPEGRKQSRFHVKDHDRPEFVRRD